MAKVYMPMKTNVMKNRRCIGLFASMVAALMIPAISNAQYYLTANDAADTSSFNNAGNWNNGAAPSAGNAYSTEHWLLRSPASGGTYLSGNFTFAGSSLTIGGPDATGGSQPFSGSTGGNDSLIFKASALTLVITNLIVDGGQVRDGNGDGQITYLAGNLYATTNGCAFMAQDTNVIESAIGGPGPVYIGDNGSGGPERWIIFTSASSTYSGNIILDPLGSHSGQTYSELMFAPGSIMNFVIGANGQNNSLSGRGTVQFNGNWDIDLTNAANTNGDVWTLVSFTNMTVTYGSTFSINGFTRSAVNANLWNAQANDVNYQYNQTNGELTASAISISQQPADESVAIGNPADLSVTASGPGTLDYQWYFTAVAGASPILDATNASYAAVTTAIGVTNYFAVVANGITPPVTSSLASITVRVPRNLEWAGAGSSWDTSSQNWLLDGSQTAYLDADDATFDNVGAAQPAVSLAQALHPTSVTVAGSTSYAFNGPGSLDGPGNLTMNGSGTLLLETTNNTYSGGTLISSGTLQIGDGTISSGVGSGPVTNNSAIVAMPGTALNETISGPISGSGSLTLSSGGVLYLAASNSYTGNTLVNGGTLALTNAGSISDSAAVTVNGATFDVSGVTGVTTLSSLRLNGASLNVSVPSLRTPVSVSSLILGGATNTININALPPMAEYPAVITLIQSAASISGSDIRLGTLPATYAGSVNISNNDVVLTLVVGAAVSFSTTNTGRVLNPAFCGLSYEKSQLTGTLFTSNDVSLISLFSQIAPAVLRIGGDSVDTTCWGGISNETPITAAEVDAFAGFVKALPANWRVIYGINMSVNSPTNCAAEAAYAARDLGSRLLGFEIGNEPDLYSANGIRSGSYTFANFLSQWQALAAAITNAVPGWAVTNGGNGWTLTGPASFSNTQGYTVPFAADEAGINSLLTQHYYLASGNSPSSTMEYLLQPDPNLPGTVSDLVAAATAANLPLGFRMDECGSYYQGGAPNVSDAYGAALWALDFMFTCAENGCQGVNFHGGGDGTGYTPIADNGTSVVQARPEFYALKMFSLADAGQGSVVPATMTLSSNLNFTAYGIRRPNGALSVLLNNKDTNNAIQVSINLGAEVTAAQAIELSGTNLNATNGYTLGGAVINPDGSWSGAIQSVTPASNGQLTFLVPPITAVLLNPVVSGPSVTRVSVQSGNIFISGTNGTSGNSYEVLTSTNVALPLSNWTVLETNTFMADGSFSFTNTINGSLPGQFFILKLQ